jgi:Spy/CpxP family protein refolding chaperone
MRVSLVMNLSLGAILAAGLAAMAQDVGPGAGPAQGGGPGFGMHRPPMERALGLRGQQGRWWNDPAMVDKLKLTDDQRKAMDAILLNHREQLVDMRAAVEKSELEMEPLMQDDVPNEARVLAQIDKIAQARAELEKANARFLLAIRAKLSPDQWKQLQTARADRMQRRGGWGREGQPGGPGAKPQSPPPPGGPGPQGMLEQELPPGEPAFE